MPQIYKLFSIPPNNSTTILHLLFTRVTYFQIADICSTLFLRAGASYRTYQQIDATKKNGRSATERFPPADLLGGLIKRILCMNGVYPLFILFICNRRGLVLEILPPSPLGGLFKRITIMLWFHFEYIHFLLLSKEILTHLLL